MMGHTSRLVVCKTSGGGLVSSMAQAVTSEQESLWCKRKETFPVAFLLFGDSFFVPSRHRLFVGFLLQKWETSLLEGGLGGRTPYLNCWAVTPLTFNRDMQERVISFGSIRLIPFSPFSPSLCHGPGNSLCCSATPCNSAKLRSEKRWMDAMDRRGGGHPSFKRLETVAKTLIAPPSRLD